MALTVKELQDDHIVSIKISGFFYKRVKTMFVRFLSKQNEEFTKAFIESESDPEKFFSSSEEAFDVQTMLILLKEIEKAAVEQKQFDEKEILEPGDEGYVEPTSED
jgi:hypothetical protein